MSGQARLSVRIDLPNGGRFGPGKAALLRAIASEGSIRKAAAAGACAVRTSDAEG